MPDALEITTFRLLPGTTAAAFVAANADINIWLKRQPGFASRQIAELDDGSIADVLVWGSAAEGEDAAERIVAETSDSPVHAMIDQKTVIWRIADVRQSIEM